VRRYRKVRLTEQGLEVRPTTALSLLIADGIVPEFGGAAKASPRSRKSSAPGKAASKSDAAETSIELSGEGEALATRLKEWRSAEAKKLGVPAYIVLNDRTLRGIASTRPQNPRQLLEVSGMGPAKAERFGEQILEFCKGAQ